MKCTCFDDRSFQCPAEDLGRTAAHVIFILATTEPERIPMTILSRCQRYEFRRITSDDIAKRLLYVAGREQIDLTRVRLISWPSRPTAACAMP